MIRIRALRLVLVGLFLLSTANPGASEQSGRDRLSSLGVRVALHIDISSA